MITDDPGTPGNGRFEINLAVAFDHRPHETAWDLPAIDLNYGVGERIQLTLQTAPVLLKRSGHGPIYGLGSTEAAVKWRFLDEESDGISVSMFPRVIFNILQSSVRRGLAEDGTRVQLPFQVAKKFGAVSVDFEWGPLASTVGRSEWLYGIIGGIEANKTTTFMAELHGTSRMNFDRDVLTVNVGIRQKLTDAWILISSIGHDVRTPDDEPFAFIGYCGVQLLY
ncbi:MAG TPA: hypothetical protein VGQ82_00545 [Chthoniobacterales bacterium]|nr:hypothetical protein [Chthoniobacterales bacterium]